MLMYLASLPTEMGQYKFLFPRQLVAISIPSFLFWMPQEMFLSSTMIQMAPPIVPWFSRRIIIIFITSELVDMAEQLAGLIFQWQTLLPQQLLKLMALELISPMLQILLLLQTAQVFKAIFQVLAIKISSALPRHRVVFFPFH